MPNAPDDLEQTAKRDAEAAQPGGAAPIDPEEEGWTQPESSAQKSASPGQSWLEPEGS